MGSCYVFTIKVDAAGFDYSSPQNLVRSMAKNSRKGRRTVGHTWVRLEGGGYLAEGGHSGETGEPGLNPRITNPNFLWYSAGVAALNLGESMSGVSEADPANPIRWLRYIYEDGHWAEGSGGHKKVTSECSWCLTASEFEVVKRVIGGLQAGGGALLRAYGLTGKQCTSTAADIAAAGGINLDPFIDMTFPSTVDVGKFTVRLWNDPAYSSLRFALPDKMGDIIKQWSGSRQKICN